MKTIKRKYQPKVSILMTVFDEEKYILRSLNSLINQSYKKWEAIIVDDFSTDNTAKIIKKLNDKRIKYTKLQKHMGRNFAINHGLKRCSGKYISILDADDFYIKDKLKKQIDFFGNNKEIKFLASWANVIDQEGKRILTYKTPLTYNKIKKKLLFSNIIGHSSIIYEKNFAKRKKLIPYKFKYAVDYELTLKFLKFTRIHVILKPLVTCTWRDDSVTNLKKNRIIVIKDDLRCLNYAKNNFKFNFNNKVFFYFKKLKLILKLIKVFLMSQLFVTTKAV
jgi:glycosyltransferase involved in cell wall biosynthesis